MITLDGIPIGLPDQTGELQKWLDAYLPLEGMRDQSQTVSLCTNRPQSRSGYRPAVGLPLMNYPAPPAPKLNTLYWPSGAVRWARGYYLAGQSQIAQITQGTTSELGPLSLVLKDEINNLTLTATVYLLPPRPISAPDATATTDKVFLLPLVDQRYYWQFKNGGAQVVSNTTQWEDLFSSLGTALGAAVNYDAIAAAYEQPDIDELTRRYDNAAVLLDAVAHSVGQRIVCSLGGAVYSKGAAGASTAYNQNLYRYNLLMGGTITGNAPAITPAKVTVTFPKWREGQVDPNGDVWPVNNNAGSPSTSGTTKTIHSTAVADFTLKSSGPDNVSNVNTVASQIASDYYAWLKQFDLSVPSLFGWNPTGFEDCVEWCFGRVHGEQYQAYTRVQSLPYNFGDEEQCQRFEGLTNYPRLARVSLTANLTTGGNAAAKFVSDTSAGTTVTSDTLTVYDSISKTSAASGTTLWAEYKSDTLRWEVVASPNLIWHVTAPTVSSGASATVSLPDGRSVSATAIGSFNSGDSAAVFEDLTGPTFYLIGPGSSENPDNMAIVRIDSANADGYCKWTGSVQTPPDASLGYCTDGFTDSVDCYVMVLNSDVGSAGSKVALNVGELYVARFVGTFSDDKPVYAIRNDKASPLMRFELTSPLSLGGQAGAKILTFQGGQYSTAGTDAITVIDMTRATFEGLAAGNNSTSQPGWRGWCTKMSDSNAYEIVWMEHTANAIAFRSPNASGEQAVVDDFYQGHNPDSASLGVTVNDTQNLFRNRTGDFKGLAIFDPSTRTFEAVQAETWAGAGVFQLTSAFADSGNANGSFTSYFGSQQDIADPHGDGSVIITDEEGLFRFAAPGSQGAAILDSEEGIYRAILADQLTVFASAQAAAEFNQDFAAVQIKAFDALTPYPFSVAPNINQALNPLRLTADEGDTLILAFDASRQDANLNNRYFVLAVQQPDKVAPIMLGQAYTEFDQLTAVVNVLPLEFFGGLEPPGSGLGIQTPVANAGRVNQPGVTYTAFSGLAFDLCWCAWNPRGDGGNGFYELMSVESHNGQWRGQVATTSGAQSGDVTLINLRANDADGGLLSKGLVWAQNVGGPLTVFDDVVVFRWTHSNKTKYGYFCFSPNAGSDKTAVVSVQGGQDGTSFLWPGYIQGYDNIPPGNYYPIGTHQNNNGDCWLFVLNEDLGSSSPVISFASLAIGSRYVGYHVADFDNGDSTFTPIYAIRPEQNDLYAVVASTNAAAGATFSQSLPIASSPLTVTNWSKTTSIATSDDIFVALDKSSGSWNAWKSGGGGTTFYKCQLNGALLKTDSSATIDTVTAFDGSTAPSPTTATNTNKLDAIDNTPGVIIADSSSGSTVYKLLMLSDHKARYISGTLGSSLTAGGSVSCSVSSYRDGQNPGSTVTVYSDESIFTGTSGKAFKAYYSPEDDKYYFLWVGC